MDFSGGALAGSVSFLYTLIAIADTPAEKEPPQNALQQTEIDLNSARQLAGTADPCTKCMPR